MINPVTNFAIDSTSPYTDVTYVLFKFTKPVDASAYKLYRSSDNITYSTAAILSDTRMMRSADTSTIDDGGITFFPYAFEDNSTNGKKFYFKIVAVDIERNESTDSPVLEVVTFCDAPTDLSVSYDGYANHLSWKLPDLAINTDLSGFKILQADHILISNYTIYDYVLSSADFTTGDYILVVDYTIRNIYGGVVTTEGQFDLETKKYTQLSDVNTDFPNNYNLKVYKAGVTGTSVVVPLEPSWTSTGVYSDVDFEVNTQYIYKVTSVNSNGDESQPVYFPVYDYDLSTTYPFIRTPDNSSNTTMADSIWKKIKKALMGDIFYKKETWAIPYMQNEPYTIKGFCGVSNCKVDLFVNNIYSLTTSSGEFGDFEISKVFTKKEVDISVQCRDKYNVKFSFRSPDITVHFISMYSWFYAIGQQVKQIQDWITYVKNGILITQTTYPQFVDNYQALIELQKFGDENQDAFKEFAYQIFNTFEYVGFDQSLILLLEAFTAYTGKINSFEIYNNYDLFDTLKTGYTFVPSVKNLTRNIYNYKITAVMTTSTGYEETAGTVITVDTRNWPVDFNKYIMLQWPPMAKANFYNVYKEAVYTPEFLYSSTGYQFVVQTTKNIWGDVGLPITSTGMVSPEYNYSTLNEVESINFYYKTDLSAFDDTVLKQANYLVLIIYLKDNETLSSYNLARLFFYLDKIFPPEKNYIINVCNNTSSILYKSDGTQNILVMSVQGVAILPTVYPNNLWITPGTPFQLSLEFTPDNATDKTGVWALSPEGNTIATIDQTGLITWLRTTPVYGDPEYFNARFTSNDGGFVAISQNLDYRTPTVTGVHLATVENPYDEIHQYTNILMLYGSSQQLVWSPIPDEGYYNPIEGYPWPDTNPTFISNNPSVISISSTGLITSEYLGSATITFRVTYDRVYEIIFYAQTYEALGLISSTTLSPNHIYWDINNPNNRQDPYFNLSYFPSNPTDSTGVWTSSNPSVATMIAPTNNNSAIDVGGVGESIITWHPNQHTINATIDSKTLISGYPLLHVFVNVPYYTIAIGESEQATITLDPTYATILDTPESSWIISSGSGVSLSPTGVITGTSTGSALVSWETYSFNSDGDFTQIGGGVTINVVETIHLTNVTMVQSTITIMEEATYQLTPAFTPGNATDKTGVWASLDEGIATVSSTGLVTGVLNGSTTITFTSNDGGFVATTTTNVSAIIHVTNVAFATSTGTIAIHETLLLTPIFTPSNATDQTGTWSSSDEAIASVNNGYVYGVTAGNTTITFTSTDGGHQAFFFVTCEYITVTGVTVEILYTEMTTSDVFGNQVIATITPANATNQNGTWVSSNPSIVTLDLPNNFTCPLTAHALGSSTFTYTTEEGGFFASVTIDVVSQVFVSILNVISKSADTMAIGDNGYVQMQALPYNATDKTITFSTTTPSILDNLYSGPPYSDDTVVFDAVAVGTGVIRATAADAGTLFVDTSFNVTDHHLVTSVSVAPETATINSGDTLQLTETVLPANAEFKTGVWTSSDETVALVSSTGLVTGV